MTVLRSFLIVEPSTVPAAVMAMKPRSLPLLV